MLMTLPRYVVRDASGQAIAYPYSRDNPTEALQAKMLTPGEARRIAISIARRPEAPREGGAAVAGDEQAASRHNAPLGIS